jgi:iron(III) transport system ATP-binding protein
VTALDRSALDRRALDRTVLDRTALDRAAPRTTAPGALTMAGVVAGYAGHPVLRGVDLEVPAGALLAVLGGSGSGKTTLLRTIAGFHRVEAGSIYLAGRLVAGGVQGELVDVPAERRRVGLVPQDGALFGHLTVAGNVAFGLDRAARRGPRVGEVLELVGLAGLERRMPAELSGGQQQRVALARALAPGPALVLLDEPFTALDAGLRAEVREQVRAVLRAAGATAVLVTHDQQEALGAADVVAVLRDGRVVQSAPPRTLYAEPVDLAVGTFVGEAVVLSATVRGGRAETALGALPVTGPDGTGQVLVRPEQLRLGRPGDVVATVVEVVFHGHDTTVLLALDGTGPLLRCRTAEPVSPGVGERVGVTVRGPARFYPG